MKSCTHSGCDVKFSSTDSHPCCFAHRLCGRTGASGSTGGDACEHCSHWSALQVEACRKRRAAWDRSRKRPSNPAAFSRPSPDSVVIAVPAEMSTENPTPGPSPPTLTPVLEEVSRGDPASPAPKSPVPTETQAILTALSRVVERLDSLENRERPSSTKRRPEARRSLDPESSSPPPKRGRGDTDSRRTAVESLPRLQTRAARSSPDRERPLSSNTESTPPRASRDGRACRDTHQRAGRSSPHHRRHLVRESTRRETSGQPRPDPSASSTTSTSRRSRERSTPPGGTTRTQATSTGPTYRRPGILGLTGTSTLLLTLTATALAPATRRGRVISPLTGRDPAPVPTPRDGPGNDSSAGHAPAPETVPDTPSRKRSCTW